MPDLNFTRAEIERMRVQIGRQRKEILQLQKAGIPTASAEALLERMLADCRHPGPSQAWIPSDGFRRRGPWRSTKAVSR